MKITLAETVFDFDSGEANPFDEVSECGPEWDSLSATWTWEKNLGECGMEVTTLVLDNGDTYIQFLKTFTNHGDQATINDSNGKTALNFEVPLEVRFQCLFSPTFQVYREFSAQNLQNEIVTYVDEKDEDGTTIKVYDPCNSSPTCNIGEFNWAGMFVMSGFEAEGDAGKTYYLGETVCPNIHWTAKPTSLHMLKIYPISATVTMHGQSIKPVDGTCYSERLGASRMFEGVAAADHPKFGYSAFGLGNLLDTNPTSLKVVLGVCVDSETESCDLITDSKDCPGRDADGNDFLGYMYSVDGVTGKSC